MLILSALSIATQLPPPDFPDPERISHSHIESGERSLPCDTTKSGSLPGDGPRPVEPCDLDEWEGHVVGTYPRDALRDNAEGTIRIYGMVDGEGRFADCAVTTLGNPFSLGRDACGKIKQHGKFRVALNDSGQPVAAPVALSIKYILPAWPAEDKVYSRKARPLDLEKWAARIAQNYPATPIRQDLSGVVSVRVVVDRLGHVARCKVTQSSAKPITEISACKGMARYARFEPALDANGKPTLGVYDTAITYQIR